MLPSAIVSYLVPRLGAWTTQIVGAVLATAVTSYVFKPTAAPAPAPAAIESRVDAANESSWARQASAPFDRADMLLPRPTFAAEVAPFPLQQGAMRPARAADVVFVAGTAANVATASVASLQQIFAGVTDAASAKLAEPKLKDAAAQVDKASAAIMALPEAARATVATQAKPAVANLKDQVAKILAIPGVGDVLKPIVEPMMAKLSAIAGG